MTTALYPAEFIFPGHPDKLADAIADGLVQAARARDARALAGVEVAVHRDHVYVTGRLACPDAASIAVDAIVREVYRSAGYGPDWQPAPEAVTVHSNLCLGPLEDGEAEFRELSDDQAICIGHATEHEATNHLPVEQWLVSRFARRLHALREEFPHLGLGPDGKVLVTVAEQRGEAGSTFRLASFSTSLQQRADADAIGLHRAVREAVTAELAACSRALPALSTELPDTLTVNGAGAFEVGGPEGDNGLSGKKLVVDAYGPRVPIGGGATAGKDRWKVDRYGPKLARRMAVDAVLRQGYRECTVTLAISPGDREFSIASIRGMP